jgi:DHA2 family methylenomycin A resistance protein-like MFS transporter
LGVALFGSLAGQHNTLLQGAHLSLVISAGLLLVAAAAIWFGASRQHAMKV